jgi:hypothetical protein
MRPLRIYRFYPQTNTEKFIKRNLETSAADFWAEW